MRKVELNDIHMSTGEYSVAVEAVSHHQYDSQSYCESSPSARGRGKRRRKTSKKALNAQGVYDDDNASEDGEEQEDEEEDESNKDDGEHRAKKIPGRVVIVPDGPIYNRGSVSKSASKGN